MCKSVSSQARYDNLALISIFQSRRGRGSLAEELLHLQAGKQFSSACPYPFRVRQFSLNPVQTAASEKLPSCFSWPCAEHFIERGKFFYFFAATAFFQRFRSALIWNRNCKRKAVAKAYLFIKYPNGLSRADSETTKNLFRLLFGVRLNAGMNDCRFHSVFNLRPRVEGATCCRGVSPAVSIHAPAWGLLRGISSQRITCATQIQPMPCSVSPVIQTSPADNHLNHPAESGPAARPAHERRGQAAFSRPRTDAPARPACAPDTP